MSIFNTLKQVSKNFPRTQYNKRIFRIKLAFKSFTFLFALSLHLILNIILHDHSRHEILEKGSESETETDDLHITHDHEFPEDIMGCTQSNTQNTYDELLTE